MENFMRRPGQISSYYQAGESARWRDSALIREVVAKYVSL